MIARELQRLKWRLVKGYCGVESEYLQLNQTLPGKTAD
jgi:hypothetical protein